MLSFKLNESFKTQHPKLKTQFPQPSTASTALYSPSPHPPICDIVRLYAPVVPESRCL